MKSLKILLGCKIATFAVLSVLTFASCSYDEETPTTPAYVGTWLEDKGDNNPPPRLSFPLSESRSLLTLTTSIFEMREEIKYAGTTSWIINSGDKGSINVVGNRIIGVYLETLTPQLDSNHIYISVKYCKFPAGYHRSFFGQWSVVDNKLIINFDDDGDGIYDGEYDSVLSYTKL